MSTRCFSCCPLQDTYPVGCEAPCNYTEFVTNVQRLFSKIRRRDPSKKTEHEWIATRTCLNRPRFVKHGMPLGAPNPRRQPAKRKKRGLGQKRDRATQVTHKKYQRHLNRAVQ